jgi:hypothetical protein
MVYLLTFIVFYIIIYKIKVKFFSNKFIKKHKELLNEIKQYEEYLEYCKKTNSIPLHFREFKNILHIRNGKLEELLK